MFTPTITKLQHMPKFLNQHLINDAIVVEIVLSIKEDQKSKVLKSNSPQADFILLLCSHELQHVKKQYFKNLAAYSKYVIPVTYRTDQFHYVPKYYQHSYRLNFQTTEEFKTNYTDLIISLNSIYPPKGVEIKKPLVKILGLLVHEIIIHSQFDSQTTYNIPFLLSQSPSKEWKNQLLIEWERQWEDKPKPLKPTLWTVNNKVVLSNTTFDQLKYQRALLMTAIGSANIEFNINHLNVNLES